MRKRLIGLLILAITAFANASIVYDHVLTDHFHMWSSSGTSKTLIDGGWGEDIYADDYAYINIQSTGNYDISDFRADRYATIDMYGGAIHYLGIVPKAFANIYGGTIDILKIGFAMQTMKDCVAMYVTDYDFDSVESVLSGHWQDGSEFNITLENYGTGIYETINWIDFHVVPEPMTIALFGIGSLLLRRKKL